MNHNKYKCAITHFITTISNSFEKLHKLDRIHVTVCKVKYTYICKVWQLVSQVAYTVKKENYICPRNALRSTEEKKKHKKAENSTNVSQTYAEKSSEDLTWLKLRFNMNKCNVISLQFEADGKWSCWRIINVDGQMKTENCSEHIKASRRWLSTSKHHLVINICMELWGIYRH